MRKFSIALGLLLCPLIVAATANPVSAAAFVKFDGVDGEATDMAHSGWILVESISAPLHDPGPGTGATRRPGDVALEDFRVVKQTDKASAKLAEAVCNGKVFPKVEIEFIASPTDTRQTYYVYELTNVRVTSYSVSAADGTLPQEEFSLSFEEVKVNYAKANSKGKSKGNVEATWKVEKGEK